LEANYLDDEPLADHPYRRSEHDVPQLPRPHRTRAEHRRGAGAGTAGMTRPVRRRRRRRGLPDARGDPEHHTDLRARVDRGDRRGFPLDAYTHPGEVGGGPVEVVCIIDPDAELDEAASGRGDQPELLAAVDGGK